MAIRPTVEFDHYDEEFAKDPYPKLRELRERCPVAHTDAHGGFWVVSRYDDVCEIARDPGVFSSRYVTVPTDIGYGEDVRLGPLQFDPPEHTRLKRLLATAFVPARSRRSPSSPARRSSACSNPTSRPVPSTGPKTSLATCRLRWSVRSSGSLRR